MQLNTTSLAKKEMPNQETTTSGLGTTEVQWAALRRQMMAAIKIRAILKVGIYTATSEITLFAILIRLETHVLEV
jgi:hypothetical protein